MRPPPVAALAACVSLLSTALLSAQAPPHNGPRPIDPGHFALRNATVVAAPGRTLTGVQVVVRDGTIRAVDAGESPAGATVVDCTGLTIHPGLIDAFVPCDVPSIDPAADDRHWNPMLQPQRDARDGGLLTSSEREELRALGFTVVGAVPSGGILKGTAAAIALDDPTPTSPVRVLHSPCYLGASLQTDRSGYPNSEMGAIAVLRQTLADARWYASCLAVVAADPTRAPDAPRPSTMLQALVTGQRLPLWFDCQNELQELRCAAVAAEFDRRAVLVGNGMEFRRLPALAATKLPIVVPLDLPEAPDVSTAAAAERVSLRQLQSWEQAPTNSKRLLDAGVEIAWTTLRLQKRKDFPARVRDAMRHGVTAEQALAALTTVPARLLGIADRTGTIEVGKAADLVVVAGGLFDEKSEVREVWVGGRRHVVHTPDDAALDGSWSWVEGGPSDPRPQVTITGKKLRCAIGDAKLDVQKLERDATTITCQLDGDPLTATTGDRRAWLRLHRHEGELRGVLTGLDGRSIPVRMTRSATPTDEPAQTDGGGQADGGGGTADAGKEKESARQRDEPAPPTPLTPLPTPLGGYGRLELPAQRAFAIVGATLWTCDGRGNLRDGALYARGGRIVYVGPRADLPELPEGTEVIDAAGKHLTPGIIDCHSHTGISRGVNETGEAVTAEVRIQDVVDPDDVDWYRQLAGGVTAVNQLHGSANVIGGQSNTVKVRYGVAHPDEMHFQGARAGIKFALGENPRGANRSGDNERYPNTRMGVEALLRDRFAAAEVYAREHAAYRRLTPTARARVLPPRIDLELEAVAQVLAGVRRIHCHSYRQDEIFMLCGLAQEYGVRIGTFQHVLEGYKVADAIRDNAIGASSFSDWWAYKFEVYDAIPENGAILFEQGVNVSFNSDSNELARRLNSEAGKAVKYGGVPPQDALCFVTRNPAIQLGVFERTGSLTAGKDADLALWSDDPLSYAARCEATWVDGRQSFSLAEDRGFRDRIRTERTRLLALALRRGQGGGARAGDPKDAYWRAEAGRADYCCRTALEGR